MKSRTMTLVMLLVVVLGTVAVMPATAQTATRTLPSECVAGQDFTVTITADDYGDLGTVMENLCDGWRYQSSTAVDAVVKDSVVAFMLIGGGPKTFTYTVKAPTTLGECCSISGILRDENKVDYAVTGDLKVCVCDNDRANISTTRDISDQRVEPGSISMVTLTLTANVDDVQAPALKENLPAGWVVTEGDSGDAVYDSATNEWIWVARMSSGETKTVTYNVTIPADAVSHDYHIAGHASAYGVDPFEIGGESRVTVVTLCGDVNHDELLSTADAVLALQMAANNTDIDFAADVNADGAVTSVDALMIWQSMLS